MMDAGQRTYAVHHGCSTRHMQFMTNVGQDICRAWRMQDRNMQCMTDAGHDICSAWQVQDTTYEVHARCSTGHMKCMTDAVQDICTIQCMTDAGQDICSAWWMQYRTYALCSAWQIQYRTYAVHDKCSTRHMQCMMDTGQRPHFEGSTLPGCWCVTANFYLSATACVSNWHLAHVQYTAWRVGKGWLTRLTHNFITL